MRDKRAFLRSLRGRVDESPRAAVAMLGDWNFVGAEDVRLQDAREMAGGGDTIARVYDATFTDFVELVQPFPMYGRRGPEEMALLSRLDRCVRYCRTVLVCCDGGFVPLREQIQRSPPGGASHLCQAQTDSPPSEALAGIGHDAAVPGLPCAPHAGSGGGRRRRRALLGDRGARAPSGAAGAASDLQTVSLAAGAASRGCLARLLLGQGGSSLGGLPDSGVHPQVGSGVGRRCGIAGGHSPVVPPLV